MSRYRPEQHHGPEDFLPVLEWILSSHDYANVLTRQYSADQDHPDSYVNIDLQNFFTSQDLETFLTTYLGVDLKKPTSIDRSSTYPRYYFNTFFPRLQVKIAAFNKNPNISFINQQNLVTVSFNPAQDFSDKVDYHQQQNPEIASLIADANKRIEGMGKRSNYYNDLVIAVGREGREYAKYPALQAVFKLVAVLEMTQGHREDVAKVVKAIRTQLPALARQETTSSLTPVGTEIELLKTTIKEKLLQRPRYIAFREGLFFLAKLGVGIEFDGQGEVALPPTHLPEIQGLLYKLIHLLGYLPETGKIDGVYYNFQVSTQVTEELRELLSHPGTKEKVGSDLEKMASFITLALAPPRRIQAYAKGNFSVFSLKTGVRQTHRLEFRCLIYDPDQTNISAEIQTIRNAVQIFSEAQIGSDAAKLKLTKFLDKSAKLLQSNTSRPSEDILIELGRDIEFLGNLNLPETKRAELRQQLATFTGVTL